MNAHRRTKNGGPSDRSLVYVGLFAAVLLAVLSFLPGGGLPNASPEVRFADFLMPGVGIVPASCASYPHYPGECDAPPPTDSCPTGATVTTDTYGYSINNAGIRKVNKNSILFCVTNSSAGTYFIPAKTSGETQSFQDHPPSGVIISH